VQTPASAPAPPPTGAAEAEAVAAEAAAMSVAASTPSVPPALAPPRSSERVALFDLDLTLLDVNTGRLWCAVARRGARRSRCSRARSPGNERP
jgi:hypothetical protein